MILMILTLEEEKNRTIKFGFDKQEAKLFFEQKSESNHK